jgi:hypothetical protein
MTSGGIGDLYKFAERQEKEQREYLKNHKIISVKCSCGYGWKPYGDQYTILPFVEDLECPQCHSVGTYSLLDEETTEKKAHRRLGLENRDVLLWKTRNLEKQHEIDEKEKKVLKDRLNLVEAKMNLLMKWTSKRELDFREIEALADEEREKNDFRKSNR